MKIITDVVRVWKSLTKSEQRELNSEAMSSSDVGWRMRCKIIRNLVRGEGVAIIARILGCSRSQVYRVAKRFVADGVDGLVDRREDNGPCKTDDVYVSFILTAVGESPPLYGFDRPTWTQELLAIVAAQHLGVRTSTTTMSRLLATLKVRHGRPKPRVECPWPAAAKTRRLNQINRLRDNLPKGEALFYLDEVDIHLNPKIGPDWMLPGQQKSVLTPGQNQKRYLAGALNARTGRLTWVESDHKNSVLFISLVDHLLKSHRGIRKLHLVLDNFKIHSSRAVEAAKLRWQTRVEFHFLPPYCPDHNCIERFWKDLHDNVTRNHTCSKMDELMMRVNNYLNCRNLASQHTYAAGC